MATSARAARAGAEPGGAWPWACDCCCVPLLLRAAAARGCGSGCRAGREGEAAASVQAARGGMRALKS